jgi:hypothetical protein
VFFFFVVTVGVILPNDNVPNPGKIPDVYWNAAGAMYAYVFSNLGKFGIEVIGESQLVGYPTQVRRKFSILNFCHNEFFEKEMCLSLL